MSVSPYAQRPRMYHLAQWPSSICGLTSTWIQVPGGVCAFQEATSSLNWKSSRVGADVQVP